MGRFKSEENSSQLGSELNLRPLGWGWMWYDVVFSIAVCFFSTVDDSILETSVGTELNFVAFRAATPLPKNQAFQSTNFPTAEVRMIEQVRVQESRESRTSIQMT